MSNSDHEKLKKLLNAVRHCRGMVLSVAEREVGDAPTWLSLRSRLLGLFGDFGLSREIRRVMLNSVSDAQANGERLDHGNS